MERVVHGEAAVEVSETESPPTVPDLTASGTGTSKARRGSAPLALLLACGLFLGIGILSDAHVLATSTALTIVTVCAYLAFVRFVERRRCDELRLDTRSATQIATGAGIGLFLAFLEVEAGWLTVGAYRPLATVQWHAFISTFGAWLAAGVLAAYFVVLFYGLLLRAVERIAGTWAAVGVSALAYGAWPSLAAAGGLTFALWIATGVVLAAAYVLTRRLWMPLGLLVVFTLADIAIWGSGYRIQRLMYVTGSTQWKGRSDYLAWCLFGTTALAVALVILGWRRGCYVGPRRAWQMQTGVSPAELRSA
jgi:membrane protease YdiL (CAAX protease family)